VGLASEHERGNYSIRRAFVNRLARASIEAECQGLGPGEATGPE
jgi:hypothetical protein